LGRRGTSNFEHPTLNIEVKRKSIYRQGAKVAKGRGGEKGIILNFGF
jgi:hypothetical protein